MEQNTVVDKKTTTRCSAWSNDAKDKMEQNTVVDKKQQQGVLRGLMMPRTK